MGPGGSGRRGNSEWEVNLGSVRSETKVRTNEIANWECELESDVLF